MSNLSTSTSGKLHLPPSERRHFRGVEDLPSAAVATAATGSAVMLIPKAKNFPAIDAIASLTGDSAVSAVTSASNTALGALSAPPTSSVPAFFVFINVTLDKDHTLLVQGKRASSGLGPLCRALGIGGPVKFVWAVPDDQYEEFCRHGKPAALVGGGSEDLHVEQFILRVPPPRWPSSHGRRTGQGMVLPEA